MARGPRYRVHYRRRRERKTDYQARRILVTSNRPRYVVRPSNKNILIQIIGSTINGDYVITQANSSELDKFGWLAGKKNTPAAYLIGYIIGRKAQKKGVKEAILDIGLARPSKGSKVFAAVKGAIDAGLHIPCNIDIIPETDRIVGKTISEYASNLEENAREKIFSKYLINRIAPEQLSEHFGSIKTKIEEAHF